MHNIWLKRSNNFVDRLEINNIYQTQYYHLNINTLWAVPKGNRSGNINYMYLDSVWNLHVIEKLNDSNNIIFRYVEPEPSFMGAIYDNFQSFIGYLKDVEYQIDLVPNENGNIKSCTLYSLTPVTAMSGTTYTKKKIWDFMAIPVNVMCCINHKPNHCCKPIKQLKDTGTKYQCVWP